MARSVQQIQNSILSAVAADPILSGLNSPSQTAIYRLWSYIIASNQAIEEQNYDLFEAQVENIINILPPGSVPWIQAQAFRFQYSANDPQVIQFDTTNFVPYYPTVNPAYRIITNCSVLNTITVGVVNIKVAKGPVTSVPQQLTSNELSALQYYFNQIKPAGVSYVCSSDAADRLMSSFTVKYQGAYAGVIQNNLLTAYKNYLFNIGFGGIIKLVDIIGALRAVSGVNDVICVNMTARPNSITFGGGTKLVSSYTEMNSSYTTISGYVIDEDTSGNDFLSLLNLISE